MNVSDITSRQKHYRALHTFAYTRGDIGRFMTKQNQAHSENQIAQISDASWQMELEKSSAKYHLVAAWAAIIFDPVFAITDYINIPESWEYVFVIRLMISMIILTTVFLRKRYYLPSYLLVVVPFFLISMQNAYTYSLVGDEDLLGHTLNYIALLIGASMFVAWHWRYSVVSVIVSGIATAYFVTHNPAIEVSQFFVKGGLILFTAFAFMTMLIHTRYTLTVKEIKARLALAKTNEEIQAQNEEIQSQNAEIQAQGEEIKGINENLENLVRERTAELEKKNKALEEYAFINAHKLRAPVASILGLINLLSKAKTPEEAKGVVDHLNISAEKLDAIVSSITKAIEKGERK